MVVCALLLLSSSSLVPQSRFPQTRLLQLRGGSSAVTAPAPSVASQQAQPQGPLRLQLVVGSDTAVVRMPRIELSSTNVEALQLQPGARVRIHRADKRAGFKNPFQKPVPDSTLGEVREADAPTPLQPYALGETEARLPAKAMQAMRLQAGDSVLVSPVGQPAGQASRAPNAYQSRRRSGGFLNNVIRFQLYQSMLGPSYGGYGGGGYGGRRRSSYGYRSRSSYGRRAYGGRRRY